MKQRLTYLDIRCLVNEIQVLNNSYIQQIYTPSPHIFVFKTSSKHLLLIEPGTRMHFVDTYTSEMTFFTQKIRILKHNTIKSIQQIGFDRVIKIETNKYIVYIEFFAGGNIVITENNIIKEVYRPVKEINIQKGEVYIVNEVKLDFTYERWKKIGIKEMICGDKAIVDQVLEEIKERNNVLSNIEVDKIEQLHLSDVKIKDKEEFVTFCDFYFTELYKNFENIQNYGLLLYKNNKANNYFPYKIKLDNKNYVEFSTFNEALKEYYTKKEDVKVKKSDQVKIRQEKRIKELEDTVDGFDSQVELLYENRNIIEQICKAHKNVILYNLDWKDFEKYKNQETELKKYIVKSDFVKKIVTLRFINEKEHSDFDIHFMETFDVNINLMYNTKKKLKDKLVKTKDSVKVVMKKLEKKESKKNVQKAKIIRKIFWYEKFNYFFTTNKKLVISGKNAQQNDILVKKYLTKNDLYFHAEIQGAASVILLDGNKDKNDDDIEEAALMALCLNNAWKNKVVVKTYYVESEQVSKTTESGEYVKTGGFIIRGKKNFVDVFRLEYGIGILFKYAKIDDECDEIENVTQNNTKENLFEEKEAKIEIIDKLIDDLGISDAKYNKIDVQALKNDALYNFTFNPQKDDKLEFAMLVCAPWKIIKNYKYNEKLVPGSIKKGKLSTEICKKFIKQSYNETEMNCVKNITIDEYTAVLINNCKIGKK